MLPSLAIGTTAFVAGELILRETKNKQATGNRSFTETLEDAKAINNQIYKMIPKIEDQELIQNLKEIHDTVNKIIGTLEKRPEKYKSMNSFFNYYLPLTINIINRYDEIENQKLTSEESKKFMNSTKNMILKINEAFKKQLSNLYQSDMIDTDSEIKVFESMLKADGYYDNSDFKS